MSRTDFVLDRLQVSFPDSQLPLPPELLDGILTIRTQQGNGATHKISFSEIHIAAEAVGTVENCPRVFCGEFSKRCGNLWENAFCFSTGFHSAAVSIASPLEVRTLLPCLIFCYSSDHNYVSRFPESFKPTGGWSVANHSSI